MKHIVSKIFYLITILFIVTGMQACKNDLISDPDQYTKIYMVQASEYPAVKTFMMKAEEQSIVYGAAYGGVSAPDKDIEVRFKVDNSLVESFNSKNNTTYAILPDGSYELEKTSEIIPKGKFSTKPLKIKIKTLGALEAFKQYLLPISIDADGIINEKLKTSYFLIEGQRDGISIKVMSFDKGSSVMNMNAVSDIIKVQDPDLLLVKGVDVNTNRSGKVNQPAVLSQLIGIPNYQFATSIANFDGGMYGCVVYSKYPIVKNETYILPTGDTNAEKGPLGVVTVQVNDNNKLVFAGTQLNANATRRAAQLPELLKVIQTYTEDPFIIAGNFNDTPPTGAVYTGLAGIGMLYPCTNCPPNFPASNPTGYSDFIMYKPQNRFNVVSHTIGTSSTSTHLPVITQFTLYYK